MQRILVLAVIALGINALAGWAGAGSATLKTTPMKVVTDVSFYRVPEPASSLAADEEGGETTTCYKGDDLVAGGFHLTGNYLIAPPSVVTSAPAAGMANWTVRVLDPKTGGDVSLSAYAVCARVVDTTIEAAG